ncbi:MAG: DoxX family protein [Hyphomicrobiales bacterium]|nr:DoxX family protein [Hyphomicrobiales bacterium]
MTQYQTFAALAGRILLALIFVISGFTKIGAYAGTQQYMEAFGVPGALLPLVIIVELVGGLMIAAGFFTRITALALAGFTLVSAIIFHADFGNQIEMIMFLKNVAIAGGFLMLAAFGPGSLSVDERWKRGTVSGQGAAA